MDFQTKIGSHLLEELSRYILISVLEEQKSFAIYTFML